MNRQWRLTGFMSVFRWSALLSLIALFSGCTTTEFPPGVHEPTVEDLSPRPPSTQITLDQAVHFQTPQGEPIVVAACTYDVQAAGGRALHLTGTDGGAVMRIAARPSPETYLLDQREPVAIALAGTDEDSHHILYAHADGTALDAARSYSGTQTRGTNRFVSYFAGTAGVSRQDESCAHRCGVAKQWLVP